MSKRRPEDIPYEMSETVRKKMSSGYPIKTWGQVVQLGTSLGYPCAVWDDGIFLGGDVFK
jgi:hypothetical protein